MRTASKPVPSVENQSARASVIPAWNSSSRGCSGLMIRNSAMPLPMASNTSSALAKSPHTTISPLRRRMDRACPAQIPQSFPVPGAVERQDQGDVTLPAPQPVEDGLGVAVAVAGEHLVVGGVATTHLGVEDGQRRRRRRQQDHRQRPVTRGIPGAGRSPAHPVGCSDSDPAAVPTWNPRSQR